MLYEVITDRAYRHLEPAGFVQDRRGISRADADRGLSRGVSRLDHTGTPGGEDEVYLGVAHKGIGKLHRGLVDPADDILRSARLDRRLKHDPRGLYRRLLRPGVGGEYDRVPRFQRDETLEYGGRGRVRRGDDSRDNPDGLRDFDYALV